jgi:soluble lytic murein transglycosylase
VSFGLGAALIFGVAPVLVAQGLGGTGAGGPWHSATTVDTAAYDASARGWLDLAEAELCLGRVERARRAVERQRARGSDTGSVLSLLAAIELASGDANRAGGLYGSAAATASGQERGIVAARAAAAYEQAGRSDSARWYYYLASRELPDIAPWLVVRAAALEEPERGLALLDSVGAGAGRATHRARGAIELARGDATGAMTAFALGRAWTDALRAGLAAADTDRAVEYAEQAISAADTAEVRAAAELWSRALPIRTVGQAVALSDAWRRLRAPPRAVAVLEGLSRSGMADTSARFWRISGDVRSEAGRPAEAVAAYDRAARLGGRDGAFAQYLAARARIRMGHRADGYRALERFVSSHPDHPRAGVAQFLVAEWHGDAGRDRLEDSLLAAIPARWPTDEYASRARLTLASRALARGDTSRAMVWYRSEVETHGVEAQPARYFLADLMWSGGDSAAAERELVALATTDSLGYWGGAARRRLRLPDPATAPWTDDPTSPRTDEVLARIDLLSAAGLDDIARESVADAMARSEWTPQDLLALGAGFLVRGHVRESLRLGSRAARALSPEHPGVIRLLYPWPYRAAVEREAREHDLDPALLAALIRQESSFVADAVSRAGARGLMQVMPATAAGIARRLGVPWQERWLTVPDANLHVGAAHLAALLRMYRGDPVLALAAYNAGGRPVSAWRARSDPSDVIRFVEAIPYVETRAYVRAVLTNWTLYRTLYR